MKKNFSTFLLISGPCHNQKMCDVIYGWQYSIIFDWDPFYSAFLNRREASQYRDLETYLPGLVIFLKIQ